MDNFARDSGFISVHFSYECRSNRSIGTMKKGKGKKGKKNCPHYQFVYRRSKRSFVWNDRVSERNNIR